MGRVVKVFYGDDGKVRVVNVRTAKGIFKRPITKIVMLLPMSDSEKELIQKDSVFGGRDVLASSSWVVGEDRTNSITLISLFTSLIV